MSLKFKIVLEQILIETLPGPIGSDRTDPTGIGFGRNPTELQYDCTETFWEKIESDRTRFYDTTWPDRAGPRIGPVRSGPDQPALGNRRTTGVSFFEINLSAQYRMTVRVLWFSKTQPVRYETLATWSTTKGFNSTELTTCDSVPPRTPTTVGYLRAITQ